jgi:hypothetical protein
MVSEASMAIAFLKTYHPDDWIALFLKSYASGRIGQRVLPVRSPEPAGSRTGCTERTSRRWISM